MIKGIIYAVAVLGAFTVGLAGMYFAIPALAPEKIEHAEAHLDSLALVDSLARLYHGELSPDSLAILFSALSVDQDSLDAAIADSIAQAEALAQAADSMAIETEVEGAIEDSVAIIQSRFEELERDKQRLLQQVEALRREQEAQGGQEADVEELSATLTKLEDKELAGVIEKLDMEVLETLYAKASARNRTRLLQAMPASMAAHFVRRLVQPNKTTVAQTPQPAPDTTNTPSSVGSEPESMNR